MIGIRPVSFAGSQHALDTTLVNSFGVDRHREILEKVIRIVSLALGTDASRLDYAVFIFSFFLVIWTFIHILFYLS